MCKGDQWSEVLQCFINTKPVPAMFQAILVQALSDKQLKLIFKTHAKVQYYRELTFSLTVSVLLRVVLRGKGSVRSAFMDLDRFPVSLTSFYNKLANTETAVCHGLVSDTADRLSEVLHHMPGALRTDPVSGLRLLTVDGNFLAGTQRRLKETRASTAAPLPGMSVVLREDRTGLLIRIHCEEDAYTNERSLFPHIIEWLIDNDLLLGDRNFCTIELICGVQKRNAKYLFRHHKGLHLQALSERKHVGTIDTGEVYEHQVRLSQAEDGPTSRCITIDLFDETQDGDEEIVLLSNVSAQEAPATLLADLYRRRWKIEHAFQELTDYLRCEVNTLAYPKAALFSFSVAVLAYNMFSVVKGAMASVHTQEKVEEELSDYAVAEQVADVHEGMRATLPTAVWEKFLKMTAKQLACWLHQTAKKVRWERFKKSKRGAKKPQKKEHQRGSPHCSSARLLAERTKKK